MQEAVTVDVIRTPTDFLSLRESWNVFQTQNGIKNAFLRWEWISSWWETICPQAEFYIIIVRDEQKNVLGIAPFHRHPLRLLGRLNFKCLRILGADRLSGAEYPDLIMRKGAEGAVIRAIAGHLYANFKDWDCIWLPNVADWKGSGQRFRDIGEAGGFKVRQRPREFSAIALPADYDEYEQSLNKNARHHLRRCTKKLIAQGAQLVCCDEKGKLDVMLSTHVRLNRARWKSIAKGGTFRFAPREAFYERMSEATLSSGNLGFFGLRIENEFRALWFGLICAEYYYSLSLSYDFEFEEKNHTGAANVLFGQMLPLLMKRGVREFDHLGGISEYKKRWGSVSREGSDLLICANNLKGNLIHASLMWPSGRYMAMETPGEPLHLWDENMQGS